MPRPKACARAQVAGVTAAHACAGDFGEPAALAAWASTAVRLAASSSAAATINFKGPDMRSHSVRAAGSGAASPEDRGEVLQPTPRLVHGASAALAAAGVRLRQARRKGLTASAGDSSPVGRKE